MGLQPWLSLYQWLCASSKNGKNLPQTKVVKKMRWTAILRNYVLAALNLSFWPIFSLIVPSLKHFSCPVVNAPQQVPGNRLQLLCLFIRWSAASLIVKLKPWLKFELPLAIFHWHLPKQSQLKSIEEVTGPINAFFSSGLMVRASD